MLFRVLFACTVTQKKIYKDKKVLSFNIVFFRSKRIIFFLKLGILQPKLIATVRYPIFKATNNLGIYFIRSAFEISFQTQLIILCIKR